VALAERLLHTARQEQTSAEQEQAARLARMMADPAGKELTMALVDQAFRSHHPDRIADQLRHLLHVYRTTIWTGGNSGARSWECHAQPLPAQSRGAACDAASVRRTRAHFAWGRGDLRRYLQQRRQDGMRLNLNQLGEAILGEVKPAAACRLPRSPRSR
jgi:RHH-type proline utilization regulon transcriptional repressor/proline dehydrogenase/delta 1-pyrroline-5-carboxylate dehydrogenase